MACAQLAGMLRPRVVLNASSLAALLSVCIQSSFAAAMPAEAYWLCMLLISRAGCIAGLLGRSMLTSVWAVGTAQAGEALRQH
jgi:hypothetical protein